MSEADRSSVVVNIYGKNYTIELQPGQTAAQVRELAQLVDTGMRQVHAAQHSPAPVHTAVLAALNLVEELFRLQSDIRAAEMDIEQRTSRLTASLGRLFDDNRIDALSPDRS